MICIIDLLAFWSTMSDDSDGSVNSSYLLKVYTRLDKSSFVFQIFATSLTVFVSAGFFLVELFRANKAGKYS